MPINPNDINTTNTKKLHGITDVYMADNTAGAERFAMMNPDGTYQSTTRVATITEAQTGTDDKLVMTPLKVKTLIDANVIFTTYGAVATGLPNATATITPAYNLSVTSYQSNFIYNVKFDNYSDGQPITLDLGFGALPVKKSNPDNKQFEVLANQIIQDKLYSVIYNQASNEFNLMGETGNIISISEQATTAPKYVVPYTVFKTAPFDGQMIEVWFDTDSQGSDTLDIGFGQFVLIYTNQNSIDKPVEPAMIRKGTRYILVWNSIAQGWNIMNYSTAPNPTNISQLVNDSDFTTNSALNTGLATKQNTLVSGTSIKTVNATTILGSGNLVIDKASIGLGNVDNTSDLNKPLSTATTTALGLKQDKTSVATHTLVPGTTTTSQKIRLNDQTLNSDLDVDTLFSIVPTKDANGKIIIPSGADGKTVGFSRNNLIANVAPTLAEFPSPKEGDSAIIVLSDMSQMYYQYISGAWSQRFYVYGRPRTRFGTGLPVLGGSDQAGDTYVRTTDGLPTNLTGSNLVSEFVFTGYGYSANPAAWNLVNKTADAVIQVTGVTTPVTFPVTTLPGTPVFAPNIPATAGYIYQMPDGTFATWNGTQYISSPAPTVYQKETNTLVETGAILANNDLFPIVDVSDGVTANQSSYMHRVKRLSNSVMAQQEALTNANSGIIPQTMVQNGITVQVDGWIDYNGSYVSPLTLPVPLYDGQIFQVNHLATLPTTILGTNTDSGISTTLNTPNTGAAWRALAGKYYRIDNIPANISETGAATYTALDSDHTIILNSPTLQTLTIPASSTVTNREYIIVNNGAVDKVLSQSYTRFDGVTTTVIPAQSSITIQSIGALYKQTDAGNFFVGAYSASIPIVKAQGKINLGDFTTAVLQGGAVNVVSATLNSGSGTAFARYDVVLATGAVSTTNYQVNYEIESNTGEVVTATATVLYSTTSKTLTGFQFALREIVGATQNASIRFTVTEIQTLTSTGNSIKTNVNAGQTVQLGNIKIQVPTTIQTRGYEIGTVAGTMSANITAQSNYSAGWFANRTVGAALTTTYQHPSAFAASSPGDYIFLQVRDNANPDLYKVEIYIGSGFNNNVIKITKE